MHPYLGISLVCYFGSVFSAQLHKPLSLQFSLAIHQYSYFPAELKVLRGNPYGSKGLDLKAMCSVFTVLGKA